MDTPTSPASTPAGNEELQQPLLNELRLIPTLINRVEESGEVSNEIFFLPICSACREPIIRFDEANIVTAGSDAKPDAPLQSLGTIDGASLLRLPGFAIALHKSCDRDRMYPWKPLNTILKSDQRYDFEKPTPPKACRQRKRSQARTAPPHIEFHLDPRNPNIVRSTSGAIKFRVIARQGRVEFDADFFNTDLQLAPNAAKLIEARWRQESEGQHWPKMKCAASKTLIAFSALPIRQSEWCEFLTETLSSVDAWQVWNPARDAYVPMPDLEGAAA